MIIEIAYLCDFNKRLMLKRPVLILFFMLLAVSMYAQGWFFSQDDDKSRIVGYVATSDSLMPMRNVHIISKMAHCGTISNRSGFFTISTKAVDTLWVSSVGYARRLIPVTSKMEKDTMIIRLERDTVTLREIVIRPFYDYKTFKEMVINMPSVRMPRELELLNEELKDPWLRKKKVKGNGLPTLTGHPIQFLYDHFNKSARRKTKIMRNRRMFNEILRQQGRLDELLPDSLDYSIDYTYEVDTLVPYNDSLQ